MSSVIVGGPERKKGTGRPFTGTDWTLLMVLGFAMALVGSVDLALLFYPPRFGIAEWEYVTASQFAAGLPVATTGLALLAFASRARGSKAGALVAGLGNVAFVAVLLVMAVLFLLATPLALKAAQPGPMMTGIKKSIVKGIIEYGCYSVAHAVLGFRALRSLRQVD